MSQTTSPIRVIDLGNNKTIKIQHLADYLGKRSNFIRVRLKFLIWEVDVELAEAVAGYSIWSVFTDIVNLILTKQHNSIYDLLFSMRPPYVWACIAGLIAFTHMTSILMDKSCEVGFNYKNPKALQYLFARSRTMFLAFVFNLCVLLAIVVAHSYVLVVKFEVLFVAASLLSYIRLNKQYTDFVKLKKRDIDSAVPNVQD